MDSNLLLDTLDYPKAELILWVGNIIWVLWFIAWLLLHVVGIYYPIDALDSPE